MVPPTLCLYACAFNDQKTFIGELFECGLGELFVLHTGGAEPVLDQVVQDKGKLVLKDRKMMAGVTTAQFGLCNDLGIVGAVCYEQGNEWESLTFVRPEHRQLTLSQQCQPAPRSANPLRLQ
jgi:hypothetical protein